MCGIYGMVAERGALRYPEVLDWMGEALRHRGPDGHAVFTHADAVIGTERLRIIDLHERADQPFAAPGSQVYLERGPAAVRELDGMFGLAIWDHRSRTLLLARDRAGEKPLFYARAGHEILFAS